MEQRELNRSLPRASVSQFNLADLRTPIVENFLSMLPTGHEKALKSAFYNVLALVLSSFVILAFWTVYCILEPFFKPLLWALLVGTVLHPFKANLSGWTGNWLKNVKHSSNPFAVHLILVPFTVADSFSEKIVNYVWKSWKWMVGGVGLFFLTYAVYYNPPIRIATFSQWLFTRAFSFIQWTLSWINWQIVVTLNVVYVGLVIHYLIQHRMKSTSSISEKDSKDYEDVDAKSRESVKEKPEPRYADAELEVASNWMLTLSYTTWITTFLFICLQLPYPLLVACVIFLLIGTVSYLRGQPRGAKLDIPLISRYAYLMVLNIGNNQGSTDSGASVSQILSPRRGNLPETEIVSNTTPGGGGDSPSPFNSSNHPGAESTFYEKTLQRSYSEGSGHSTRPKSFMQTGLVGEDYNSETSQRSMPSPIYNSELVDGADEGDGKYLIDSNKFLYGVLCACVVVHIWNRLWLLHLLPIPVVYYGIKKLCGKVGLEDYYNLKLKQPFLEFYSNPNSELIFPTPVRICIDILIRADKKLVSICEMYLHPFVACLVVVLVVIGTILGLIFASIQVYGEGDHLVRVSVNLVNTTVSQYPEINKMLPEGWEGVMDSMVGNAYVTGKEYITHMIRDSVADKNPEKANQIERQVIELWDRIYLAWNQTWDNAEANIHEYSKPSTHGQQGFEWDELLQTGKEMPNLLEVSVLTNYAKANVGTIWAILESLWKILMGNVTVVLSAVTALLSLLLGGGTAILNLMLNLVVFFTALFYLLSSKSSTYKPVELFNRYAPKVGGSSPNAKNLARAVEEAVNGVFTASFKMAAFYGMWTWLIHTLFQVNIVFIPSIFGAVFGVMPIFGPYWAAFPAVLELWLIQGHWTKAIVMLLAQMAPMSVVDTQIYREIKGGGHPYLTGLAVAGGIFYFGLLGAIIGPLVLCCFFVAVKIGNSFLNDGSGEGSLTQRLYSNEVSSLHHTQTPLSSASGVSASSQK